MWTSKPHEPLHVIEYISRWWDTMFLTQSQLATKRIQYNSGNVLPSAFENKCLVPWSVVWGLRPAGMQTPLTQEKQFSYTRSSLDDDHGHLANLLRNPSSDSFASMSRDPKAVPHKAPCGPHARSDTLDHRKLNHHATQVNTKRANAEH